MALSFPAMTCDAIPVIENSIKTTEEVTYDTEVNVTCDLGYEFTEYVYTLSFKCGEDRTWGMAVSNLTCAREFTGG